MIVKILGLVDILVAILFALFSAFGWASGLLLVFTLILLLKGAFFSIYLNVTSFIDIAVALIIFVSFTATFPFLLVFIICLYLGVKGIFSMF